MTPPLPVNRGIHAALVVPIGPDDSIDEAGYLRQLDHVLDAPGLAGLLVNGHAGENGTTSDEEKARIVRLTRERVPANLSITSGVLAESAHHGARQAALLEAAGVDAVLVFPPFSWALGVEPSTVLSHHRIIHDAVSTPLLLYAAPVGGPLAYSEAVRDELITLRNVRGIKDGSWEVAASERLTARVKSTRPDMMVMGSGDEHLLLNYFIGTEGSQVSLAAPIPHLVCRLWEAAEAQDWATARACHARLQPLAHLIYHAAPASRANARLKACLAILGVIDSDRMRLPHQPIPREEYPALERALRACADMPAAGGAEH